MSDDTRVDQSLGGSHYWDLLHQERYTPREAAEVLNLSERVILSAAFGGELKAAIFNGDVVDISRTDLVRWLQWRENH
jgi:excisionase family DNA binding protein